MQTNNNGFESAANLNEAKDDDMELMERSHDLKQMNVMANTKNSIVELCAQLAVAKEELGTQIKELNTKIDMISKMVEKLATPTPTKTTATTIIRHCTMCKKRHENGIFWEDEKNAAKRPPNWKSVKP